MRFANVILASAVCAVPTLALATPGASFSQSGVATDLAATAAGSDARKELQTQLDAAVARLDTDNKAYQTWSI